MKFFLRVKNKVKVKVAYTADTKNLDISKVL